MGCIAGQNDHRTGRIHLQFVGIEFVAKTDVEDPGNDRVHAILRVPMRHQFQATRHFDPDHIGPRFRRLAYNDGKTHRRWKRSERLPVNVLWHDCLENGPPWLMAIERFRPLESCEPFSAMHCTLLLVVIVLSPHRDLCRLERAPKAHLVGCAWTRLSSATKSFLRQTQALVTHECLKTKFVDVGNPSPEPHNGSFARHSCGMK
jgi:hypothetical protein